MKLLYWKQTRILLLGCCNFTIILALVFLFNKSGEYSFPQNVAWQKWAAVRTQKIRYQNQPLEGRKYQQKGNHNLDIEIYYMPNHLTGNLTLILQYLELESAPKNLTVREQKNIGSYGLFSEDNKSYLTTCIHTQGETAFTSQQFAQLANDNLDSRLLPWILGLSDLRDWSCLWVKMSMSLDNVTPEKASFLLQQELFDLVSLMQR